MKAREAAAAIGLAAVAMTAQPVRRPWFEIQTRRMDVDVDGAPNAYGPPGKATLDVLQDAHAEGRWSAPIVGFLLANGRPVMQGRGDPFPGWYVSQTSFEDPRKAERDPARYVDATRISYVVLGEEAGRRGVRLGDFVAAHSRRTGRTAWAIVGDSGNPSGDEGSLHLLQALGYPFHDGKTDAVEGPEVVLRFFPGSNAKARFFRTQTELDRAAEALGLDDQFGGRARR